MSGAIWNIGFGLVMLIGGLTGKLALIGTDSSEALAVVGGALTAFGVFQVVKNKQG